ncbi:MAG: ROK family protein [Beduini sp.]|uniref:ROK family protein n=1 Tax=Beduini sp. TaxID=1922300 RepID=UPI0039905DD6
MTVNNTMNIRKMNIELVRSALLKNNGLTKNEICTATELSLASCTNILKILMDSGEIKNVIDCESTGGRRAKRFYINEQHELVLTIITVQEEDYVKMDYRIVDLSGNVVHSLITEEKEYHDDKVEAQVDILFKDYPNIKAIGISIAGILEDDHIHNANDYVFELGNLPKRLQALFKVPTVIENDLNLAVLGYAVLVPEEADKGIVLIDRGLGAGIYANGQLLKGASNFAGEIMYYPEEGMRQVFDLSVKQQVDLLVKICTSIAAIINPAIIGISGYQQKDLDYIALKMERYIPKAHLPRLVLIESKEDQILKGIIQLTLSLLKKKIM